MKSLLLLCVFSVGWARLTASLEDVSTTEKEFRVRFTLRNDFEETVYVRTFGTPFEQVASGLLTIDAFTVMAANDPEPVMYIGAKASRLDKEAVKYLPGQSHTTIVDLRKSYDLYSHGPYQVSFKHHVTYKFEDIWEPSHTVEVAAELRRTYLSDVSGVRLQPSKPEPVPISPVTGVALAATSSCGLDETKIEFSSTEKYTCTAEQQKVLMAAFRWAVKAVRGAPFNKKLYFGTGGGSEVENIYTNIQRALCGTLPKLEKLVLNCEVCGFDTVAYITPETGPTRNIYFCKEKDKYFDDDAVSRMSVVIHELSHISLIGDTWDRGYGCDNVLRLAKTDVAKARSNADNYGRDVAYLCSSTADVCIKSSGYACGGRFSARDAKHNGELTYEGQDWTSSDPRYIFWTGAKWMCAKQIDDNKGSFASCKSQDIEQCSWIEVCQPAAAPKSSSSLLERLASAMLE